MVPGGSVMAKPPPGVLLEIFVCPGQCGESGAPPGVAREPVTLYRVVKLPVGVLGVGFWDVVRNHALPCASYSCVGVAKCYVLCISARAWAQYAAMHTLLPGHDSWKYMFCEIPDSECQLHCRDPASKASRNAKTPWPTTCNADR